MCAHTAERHAATQRNIYIYIYIYIQREREKEREREREIHTYIHKHIFIHPLQLLKVRIYVCAYCRETCGHAKEYIYI